MPRIFLSRPDVGPDERALLLDAFDSGIVAPLGPHVDAFEHELAERAGVAHAAALSSGTAGLHLALVMLGIGPGDAVLAPTLTFSATVNAIAYVGATPVLIDSEPETWCLDPTLLVEVLEQRARAGRLPRAVVTVDLYGQCADYDLVVDACRRFDVPLVEDAAEALGATYRDRPAGSFGTMSVFSFNGNKIITTSGGGMLASDDPTLIERARYLATQARDPAPHYQHSTVGFNYRMSNLLAAVGRGQLRHLDEKISRRRAVNARYREAFADLEGIGFLPDAPTGRPTNWLTVVTIDPARGVTPEDVRQALERRDIESRPSWKPMHLQPVFAEAQAVTTGFADWTFAVGLCLPSGSNLTEAEQEQVIEAFREAVGAPRAQ